jgi:hypothetical protein
LMVFNFEQMGYVEFLSFSWSSGRRSLRATTSMSLAISVVNFWWSFSS